MSVASPEVLRAVKERTVVTSEVPETDARRRADKIVEARDGVAFNTILFNTLHRKLIIPSFAHFSVIVGPCGFAPYTNELPGLPYGSPYITPPLGDLIDLPRRTHRVSLEPHLDLDIISAILPGKVTQPMTFTSPVK